MKISKGMARCAVHRSSSDEICHFDGCDQDATGTVGTVALCSLHRHGIETLLDRGAANSSHSMMSTDGTAD